MKETNSETYWGLVLLVTLVLTIFVVPVFPPGLQSMVSRFMYTILFLSALFTLEKRRRWLLYIAILVFCLEWIAGIFSFPILSMVSKSLNMVFFLLIITLLIKQVATSQEVNLRVILGSIIGYLLLGLIASIFIALIMHQDPGAFNIPVTDAGGASEGTYLSESIYFSFISMATLGYGDIVPLKPYTRSLAILITVTGQLYIAIIIALLVGKFSAGKGHTDPG